MKSKLKENQKRNIYIALFTLFGFLFGVFIVGTAEVVYIMLLMRDFITYSFGLSWVELEQFGQMLALVTIITCVLWGYAAGKYWWKQIYVLKRFGQK